MNDLITTDFSTLDHVKLRIESILSEAGFPPSRTDHDDIRFNSEGWCCHYDFAKDDPDFIRLLVYKFEDLTPDQISDALQAANAINFNLKAVKVYVVDDESVSVSVEWFGFSADAICAEMINRQIAVAMIAIRDFRVEMATRQKAHALITDPALCH